MYKTLNQAENDFLRHITMWGSAAYPTQKVGNGKWIWREFWGVKGAPTVYKTKKACVEAIEPPSQDSPAYAEAIRAAA